MPAITLPAFAAGLPAARVDESLRQALGACDRARECAVLWFAEIQRRGLYRRLGHASLELYATQALGFSRNRYWQFKRLADDLDRLPALRAAVEAGDVGWTKAQQVARVATAATQSEWVEKAHKLGLVRSGADRLDLVLAGLESLVAAATDERPRAGTPAAQIIVQQCPACAAAAIVTSRGEKRIAPAQLAAVSCDARVQELGKPNRAAIPPSVRAAVLARDRHRCATPGCRSTHFLEVHHVTPRCRGGSNRAENLITLCSRCHGFAHECAGASAMVMPGLEAAGP